MEQLKEDPRWISREASELLGEVGRLVRQEMDLAACELAESARRARSAGARLGIGGVLAHVGVLVLAAAAVLGLSLLFRTWMQPLVAGLLSSAIVGVILGVVGILLVRSARRHLAPGRFVPRRALECLQEDARWLRKKIG